MNRHFWTVPLSRIAFMYFSARNCKLVFKSSWPTKRAASLPVRVETSKPYAISTTPFASSMTMCFKILAISSWMPTPVFNSLFLSKSGQSTNSWFFISSLREGGGRTSRRWTWMIIFTLLNVSWIIDNGHYNSQPSSINTLFVHSASNPITVSFIRSYSFTSCSNCSVVCTRYT